MNDKKIISAIEARDEQMLAFVVQKFSKLLWKIAASILINATSAQDVEECVADVFIYLWQYPEKYDPDKAKLSSWLSVVARSKAVDSYRRITRKREISMEEIVVESLGYAENDVADEEKDKLRSCIEGLDEKEKELVIRRYYYEQKPAQIVGICFDQFAECVAVVGRHTPGYKTYFLQTCEHRCRGLSTFSTVKVGEELGGSKYHESASAEKTGGDRAHGSEENECEDTEANQEQAVAQSLIGGRIRHIVDTFRGIADCGRQVG